MPKDRVLFRVFKEGDVIALLIDIPANRNGYYCESYMRTGQHSVADPQAVVSATRPATPDESAPLLRELTAIGYDVEELQRTPSNALAIRRKAL